MKSFLEEMAKKGYSECRMDEFEKNYERVLHAKELELYSARQEFLTYLSKKHDDAYRIKYFHNEKSGMYMYFVFDRIYGFNREQKDGLQD